MVTYRSFELGGIRIVRNGNQDLHVVRRGPSFELRLCLHHDLHPGVGVSLYHGLDPDQWLHVSVESEHNLSIPG